MSVPLKKVLIGGGSGFIGTHLSCKLKELGYEYTIVSRMPGLQRISWEEVDKAGLPSCTKAVVNLAGQNVLDPTKRWTSDFKQNIWASRVNTTKSLAKACIKSNEKPDVFVSFSGVGIYPPSPTAEYNEGVAIKEFDFFSELCVAWESAAKKADNVRTVIIRSGVVLGRDGGMIKRLWQPFFLGLGGPIGSGSQYLPWIHVDDLVSLIIFAIENPKVEGVLNGVAPHVITNKEFSTALAKAMSRPSLFPVPKIVLNLIFSEERAKMMTEGQKVIPQSALDAGFQFKYPKIDDAVRHIVSECK